MKSLLQAFVPLLLLGVAAVFGAPQKPDQADQFGFTAVPQLEHIFTTLPKRLDCDNPRCECQSCDCLDCSCTPTPLPAVVSPIANFKTPQAAMVNIKSGEVTPYKEPPPGLIVPIKTVAKKASPPAASGHYETRYAGFRGRRSYQVWVPDNSGAACANGSCSSGACANGSLPGYFYSSGGCRSCR